MLYSLSRGSKVLIISVSMVLRLVNRRCILHPGSVVAHEGDSYSLVESSVIHLSFVGQVGHGYYGKHPLLVSFLK